MGMFKSTSPSKVGGGSQYFTMEPAYTTKFWKSYGSDKTGGKMGKMPADPGMSEQRNSKKSGNCPFC